MAFLLIIFLFLIIGLIPSLVSEEKLHEIVTKLYLTDKSNLDRIYDELDKKNYLIEDYFVSDCTNLYNCNSTYYFVEPVRITFDIDSPYSDCKTYKEFQNIEMLNLFALDGDIECQVKNGERSKSVFLFDDTHKLKFKIESEKIEDDDD